LEEKNTSILLTLVNIYNIFYFTFTFLSLQITIMKSKYISERKA